MRSQALRNFYNFSCKSPLRLCFVYPNSEKEKEGNSPKTQAKAALLWLHELRRSVSLGLRCLYTAARNQQFRH